MTHEVCGFRWTASDHAQHECYQPPHEGCHKCYCGLETDA